MSPRFKPSTQGRYEVLPRAVKKRGLPCTYTPVFGEIIRLHTARNGNGALDGRPESMSFIEWQGKYRKVHLQPRVQTGVETGPPLDFLAGVAMHHTVQTVSNRTVAGLKLTYILRRPAWLSETCIHFKCLFYFHSSRLPIQHPTPLFIWCTIDSLCPSVHRAEDSM